MKSDKNTTDNRYWESYLTRYLVGTVVGAVCLFYLTHPELMGSYVDNDFIRILKKMRCEIKYGSNNSTSVYILALAMLGFAHCYLVSAPLTFLHHARLVMYDKDNVKKFNPSQIWMFIVIYVLSLSAFGVFCLGICCWTEPTSKYKWYYIVILSFILLCSLVLIFFTWSKCKYELAKRAFRVSSALKAGENKADRSTYKALSEHGNAYSIVILQILSVFIIKNTNDCQLLTIVLLWIGLGAICLFIAKRIEYWYVIEMKEDNKGSVEATVEIKAEGQGAEIKAEVKTERTEVTQRSRGKSITEKEGK